MLLLRSIGFFAGLLLLAIAADLWSAFGVFALAAAILLSLTPRFCSVYDRYFWSHERLWKFYVSPPSAARRSKA